MTQLALFGAPEQLALFETPPPPRKATRCPAPPPRPGTLRRLLDRIRAFLR